MLSRCVLPRTTVFAARRRAFTSPASATSPHSYTVLLYEYAATDQEELAKKRTPLRPAHLKHAQVAAARGQLALGGAWGDSPMGGMLVFRTSDQSAVRAFAEADPYVTGGLVKRYSVRPWTVVIESSADKLA